MKLLKGIIRTAIVAVIAFFIYRLISREWSRIRSFDFSIDIPLLAVSVLMLVIGFSLLGIGWTMILKHLGAKIGYGSGSFIYFKTVISRYVPGVIWPYIGRYMHTRKKNIKDSTVSVSIVMEIVLLVLSSTILSFISIIPYLKGYFLNRYYIYLMISLSSLIILHPKAFRIIMNIISKALREKPTEILLKASDIFRLLVIYFARFTLLGIAFVVFVESLIGIEISQYPLFFGIGIFSWLVGYLFFIVPAGIGVKEAVMIVLLEGAIPTHLSIILAVASRIWLIAGELITLAILSGISRWRQ